MKKKVIVPIVLSSITLLLGGLIYLGISSFPELLESEDSIKAKEANAPVLIDDTIIFEEEKFAAPEVVEATSSSSGASEYVPSSMSGDVTYVDAPSSSYEGRASVSTSKSSSKELAFSDSHPLFHIESGIESVLGDFVVTPSETVVDQPVISYDHVSNSYTDKVEETVNPEVSKTKKTRVNKNKSIRSNEALIETSLLVIGAIDILSMVLIYRRKHLFR